MKKLLTRILITLSVLLLGGHGSAFATSSSVPSEKMPVSFHELQDDDATVNLLQDAKFKTSFSPYQKQVEKIDPTDSEEEEESQTASKKLSVKKQTVTTAAHFAAVFSVSTPEHHYTSIKKRTDNYTRFSYSISNRWYILFRVIRI